MERGRHWQQRFAVEEPEIAFRVWPEEGDPLEVEYLVAWQPPEDPFQRYPNLRVVFSIGAGVDQFDLASFPGHVRLVRMLDPGILQGMREYATLAVLALHRDLPHYMAAQREARWQALPSLPAQRRRVGIMGLGNLGAAVAETLGNLGFMVSGWSRSRREIRAVECFAGDEELGAFLANTDILVCLLPLTEATRGILCRDVFSQLSRGARLLNIGRGAHLNETDLLAALDDGQLSAAMLDVLEKEPPSDDHPFWRHPRILLTPHVAAATQVDTGCDVLLDNLRRYRAGLPMYGEVNVSAGY